MLHICQNHCRILATGQFTAAKDFARFGANNRLALGGHIICRSTTVGLKIAAQMIGVEFWLYKCKELAKLNAIRLYLPIYFVAMAVYSCLLFGYIQIYNYK